MEILQIVKVFGTYFYQNVFVVVYCTLSHYVIETLFERLAVLLIFIIVQATSHVNINIIIKA